MATEILSDNYETLQHASASAVASKGFIAVGGRVLMALNAYGENEEGPYAYEAARVRVPKTTGQAWTVGQAVYLITATGIFTTTASTNVLAGMVAEAAESAASEGKIHLTPFA